jgi:hypothetical protein
MRRRSLPTVMTMTVTLGVFALTMNACGRDDARDQRTEGAPAGIDRPMGTGDPGAAPMGTAGVNVNVTGCLERADDGAGTYVLTQVRQDEGGVGTTGQAGREGERPAEPMMAGMERLRLAPATTEDLGRHEGQRVSITGRLEQYGAATAPGAGVGTGAGTGTGQGTGARPGTTPTEREPGTGATGAPGAGMGAAPGTGAGASLLHVESIRDLGE